MLNKYFYISILLGAFALTGCTNDEDDKKGMEAESSLTEQSITIDNNINTTKKVEKAPIPINLTQEQKEEYHKQYVKIVEKVNQQKLGMDLEVCPMDEFEAEDWVEPKVFAKRIQERVDVFLREERKALTTMPTEKNQTATRVSDGWALEKDIYVAGIITQIEVIGDFETQYSESRDGQVFSGLNKISTQVAKNSNGTWEQKSYKTSLLDDGQTYSIRIEGIHHFNNISIDKLFTIEFSCDENGGISEKRQAA